MTVFENPFYILGASMRDNRGRLKALYDEKSLLGGDSCEDAFRRLTSPTRRIEAELRWFPGVPQNRIAEILSRLHRISGEASLGGLCRLEGATAPNGELNQLLTLLPRLRAESMDAAVLEASRLLDAVRPDALFAAINEDRQAAGISLLQSQRELDEAWNAYRDEVCRSFVQSVSRMAEQDYDILITRIAPFGVSPVVEAVLLDYELRAAEKLDRLEAEIIRKAGTFNQSLRDYRVVCTEEFCAALLQWNEAMKPLQLYAGTIGSNQIIREREARVINALQVYAKSILPGWENIRWLEHEWIRHALNTLRSCVDELVYQKRFEECGLILQLCRSLTPSDAEYEPYRQWANEKSSILEQIETNKKRQERERRARQEEDARRRTEQETHQKSEQNARQRAQQEAHRQSEDAARRRAEQEARQRTDNIYTFSSSGNVGQTSYGSIGGYSSRRGGANIYAIIRKVSLIAYIGGIIYIILRVTGALP